MMFSSSIQTIVGAALFSIIAACPAHSDYKIGPQDKLRVRRSMNGGRTIARFTSGTL